MPKIFYVEDEPFLAKIVKESLESRGYEIMHKEDGTRIIDLIDIWKPDLIILDVMLPVRDGFSLAVDIREKNQVVPIIFLTAKDQSQDVIKGFKKGGNDYIKKPFSMEELILRIENLLKLSGSDSSINDVVTIGNYTYNNMSMRLTIEGDNIQLSHRENEIIHLLYNHRNKRLDRKKILMDVWGDDSFFNSRNLDVYIRKIRQYFAKDSLIQIITLKGVGYHFIIEKG